MYGVLLILQRLSARIKIGRKYILLPPLQPGYLFTHYFVNIMRHLLVEMCITFKTSEHSEPLPTQISQFSILPPSQIVDLISILRLSSHPLVKSHTSSLCGYDFGRNLTISPLEDAPVCSS